MQSSEAIPTFLDQKMKLNCSGKRTFNYYLIFSFAESINWTPKTRNNYAAEDFRITKFRSTKDDSKAIWSLRTVIMPEMNPLIKTSRN